MEEITSKLLSDMAVDPSFIHEWDELLAQSTQQTLRVGSNSSFQDSPANMLSFGGSSSPTDYYPGLYDRNFGGSGRRLVKEEKGYYSEPPTMRTMSEHAIAEKKRRENMTQKFIALSAIVPGLKKLDKATVLLDTINYIKQLKEKVDALEAQTANNTVADRCSSTESNTEVKISGKTILINIHCENHKGILVKVFAEIERIGLTIISASSTPFSSSFLEIVVLAEMEDGFGLQAHDVIEKLNLALRHSS